MRSALEAGNRRLAKSALEVRGAGRANDKHLVHVNTREMREMNRMFGPATRNPHTGLPEHGFFSKLAKTAKATRSHVHKVFKGASNALRGKGSIFGGTPLATKLSNAVTGRHDKPIADQYGGMTPEEKAAYKEKNGVDGLGYSSELHAAGSAIGAYYGGAALGGAIGAGAQGLGASAGVASAAGTVGSKAAMAVAANENAKAMNASAERAEGGSLGTGTTSKKKATGLLLGRASALADRPYTPYEGQRVAGLTANEQQASDMAHTQDPRVMQNYDKAESAIDDSTKEYNSKNLEQYLSPFRDSGIQKENEEYDRQNASLLNSKAGAFGGDRAAFATSELNRTHMNALSDLNASAYRDATNAFFQDATRKQSASDAYRAVGGDISQLNRQQMQDLMATGGLQHVIDQGNLDFNYQQFVENRDWDVTNLEPLMRALTTSGQPGANPKGDNTAAIAGAAATIAGAYFQSGSGTNTPASTTPTTPTYGNDD